MNPEAALRPRTGVQQAAVDRHALTHADEPVTGPGLVVSRSAAIVGDIELQLAGAGTHLDGHMRGPGALDGVGERLLDDAVGGEAESRRQPVRLALDAHVDLQAAALGVLGQLAELRQARMGERDNGPPFSRRIPNSRRISAMA